MSVQVRTFCRAVLAVTAPALLLAAAPSEGPVRGFASVEPGATPSELAARVGVYELPPGTAVARVDTTRIHLAVDDQLGRAIMRGELVAPGTAVIEASKTQAFGATAGFTLPAALPPGMYAANVTVDDGALLDASGAPVPVQIPPGSSNLYIPVAPERLPALVPGQRFIDVAADESGEEQRRDPSLMDHDGQPVTRARIGLRPLTLTSIDTAATPHVLTFRVENIGDVRLSSDADVAHLTGLAPLVDDPEVSALERRFAGKTAWLIRNTSVSCVNDGVIRGAGSLGTDAAIAIEHVYRAWNAPTTFAGIGNLGGLDQASGFFTTGPLIVTLRIPAADRFYGSGFASSGTTARTFDLHADCPMFSTRAAGRWDFERLFSLQSMAKAHPQWSAAIRSHIAVREVRRGMTHAMIAQMFGYPPVYGTRSALETLAKWDYEQSAPFSFAVYFAGDAVVGFDPPGYLP